MAKQIAKRRAMFGDELIAVHDVQAPRMATHVSFNLEELARRESAAASAAPLELSKAVATDSHAVKQLATVTAWLTAVKVVAAVVLVVDAF